MLMHYEQTLPLVGSGMPLVIDKLFTSDVWQADDLFHRLEVRGNTVMGGCGCKFPPKVLELLSGPVHIIDAILYSIHCGGKLICI